MSENRSLGQKAADAIAKAGRSWTFLITLNVAMMMYAILQHFMGTRAFDPYPYILLNLFLSWMAANQAPVIMMSQGRQDALLRTMIERIYELVSKTNQTQTHQADIMEAMTLLLQEQKEHLIAESEAREELADDIEEVLEAVSKDTKNITE